jgi:hypothetical protein
MSFEGEIGEIDLIQRLVELGGEQFTGAIRFESDGIIKIVYFKNGDVLSASTNDRTDAIDEILLRANKVTREHVKQALAKRKESETLGDALLGLGFITRKELTWARRVQVIGILRSILGWKSGSWTIVADYLPKREEGTLFPLAQIIVELVVTDTDRSKSEQAMDSGNAVFEKASNFDDAFRRLGLNEDAEQIVAHIDGRSTAAEVADRSGKDVFNVYKLLEALRLLRLVTRADKPPVEHEVYGGGDAWDVENPDFTLDDVAPAAPVAAAEEGWAPRVDSATMEIPALTMPTWSTAPEPSPTLPAHSVWDESADDAAFAGTELAPPPIASPEPEWGFDEAQIEAARRAEVPVHASEDVPMSAGTKPPPPKARSGLMVPLIVLLLLAGGAYGGWIWWQKQQAAVPIPTAIVRHFPPKLKTRNAGVPPAGPAASTPPTVVPATTTTTMTTTPTRSIAAIKTPPPAVTATVPPRTTSAAAIKPPVTTTNIAAIKPPPPAIKPTPTVAPRLDRTTTSATITNAAPAAAVPSDAVRAKYDGMARNFSQQPGGKYTVQFELVCETASVTRAVAEGDKVWFVPTTFRGRPCYRVFWGRFETSADASAASKQLPAALGATPVVVKIPR